MSTEPTIAAAVDKPTEPPPVDDVAGHLDLSWGDGALGRLIFWIAVAFSIFQIVTAFGIPLDRPFVAAAPWLDLLLLVRLALGAWLVLLAVRAFHRRLTINAAFAFLATAGVVELIAAYAGGMPSQVVRAVHVGFLSLLGAALIANGFRNRPLLCGAMWAVGIAGFLVGLYHWEFYADLVNRSGELTPLDFVVGTTVLVVLFLLVYRVMGIAITLVCGLFLAYCLFGNLLPPPLDHRGYSYEQVIEHMAFGTEGVYGVPTLVSATYIFLFILFGSFMERAGVITFFNELSMALFGSKRGGPAKVCVASSALMGTVSGSGVANVVASGQFTIPLMKRFGFPGAFAGGVEATSSMGGQIMPPVMGAVAFIMAETIDVPYAAIVQAAIIPALLYFGACYWAVHLEAGKRGLHGLARSELPSARAEIRRNWYLILPLLVLVYLLFAGFTPLFAGAVGLALTAVLLLGMSTAAHLPAAVMRVAFWVVLGLLSAASIAYSITFVLLILTVLAVWNATHARGREMLLACRDALADGARQALAVGLACTIVGIVIGTMTLTGLGTIFGNWLIGIGKDSLIAALMLTMVFSLILGMGIPTIPNYIITSSLAAPILLQLDVPLIVSHMFVFYFGIMADLTPPVALAAFAAAPMAKENGMKIGVQAVRIALPGFIVPYMAVYDPALMMQPVTGLGGAGYWVAVVYVVAKAFLAMALWGVASVGYLMAPVAVWERFWAFGAAALLVASLPVTDEIGWVLSLAFLAWHWWRHRPAADPARAPAPR